VLRLTEKYIDALNTAKLIKIWLLTLGVIYW